MMALDTLFTTRTKMGLSIVNVNAIVLRSAMQYRLGFALDVVENGEEGSERIGDRIRATMLHEGSKHFEPTAVKKRSLALEQETKSPIPLETLLGRPWYRATLGRQRRGRDGQRRPAPLQNRQSRGRQMDHRRTRPRRMIRHQAGTLGGREGRYHGVGGEIPAQRAHRGAGGGDPGTARSSSEASVDIEYRALARC